MAALRQVRAVTASTLIFFLSGCSTVDVYLPAVEHRFEGKTGCGMPYGGWRSQVTPDLLLSMSVIPSSDNVAYVQIFISANLNTSIVVTKPEIQFSTIGQTLQTAAITEGEYHPKKIDPSKPLVPGGSIPMWPTLSAQLSGVSRPTKLAIKPPSFVVNGIDVNIDSIEFDLASKTRLYSCLQ